MVSAVVGCGPSGSRLGPRSGSTTASKRNVILPYVFSVWLSTREVFRCTRPKLPEKIRPYCGTGRPRNYTIIPWYHARPMFYGSESLSFRTRPEVLDPSLKHQGFFVFGPRSTDPLQKEPNPVCMLDCPKRVRNRGKKFVHKA